MSINIEDLKNYIHHETVSESFRVVNLKDKHPFYSYIVIIIANNDRAIYAVGEKLKEFARNNEVTNYKTEGKNTNWIVFEIEDILVHVMTQELSDKYQIEKLWELGVI
ncbi:hypothetical protein ASO20_00305 [Mycoplasma sp. (ex Biomphalaria glabrata)]|uniref:ribosome silencing factor n=1 Tax=Mycoplasma sp. (ex Biomphalaria glabrata) TaxID=1749074 RepID=UPI00073AD43B|nr:ribosome silencing factor [Mycoplasma sp. (ex Biomphalaria glabrata)]ALV23123.1 hypothetical protein ASO20_00305 [Mycoplasma sp. (ex Biomphalaria glabrata)]